MIRVTLKRSIAFSDRTNLAFSKRKRSINEREAIVNAGLADSQDSRVNRTMARSELAPRRVSIGSPGGFYGCYKLGNEVRQGFGLKRTVQRAHFGYVLRLQHNSVIENRE